AGQTTSQPPQRAGGTKRAFRAPRFAAEEFGLTPTEKGTALHLALQFIRFEKTDTLQEVQEEIERLVLEEYMTPEQGAAVAATELWAFFSSPLGIAVKGAPGLQREFKFSVLRQAKNYYPGLDEEETVLLQGVVDCFYETPEGIVILDFKTDRVTEQTVAQRARDYAPQLAAYADALEEVVGRPVVGRILWFFSLGIQMDGG
ncbi:MAG: PD-(D/E)XK nuclease family protein, partial [Oscillospiraceae bacterium]